MNLNQSIIKKKSGQNVFGFSTTNVNQVMGPPLRPPSKNKFKSNSSTSTRTDWGKSCHSVLNTSTLRSAGNTTVSSDNNESRVIMALTEGRGDARCEVGLASIDLSMPTLLLCQISDAQSYMNTLTKINILNPTNIIVPNTFLESKNRLVEKIRQKFPNIKILGIPRKTFNKSNGMDRILQLCLPSINTISFGLQHKYYALAAASALTTYLQHNLNIYYAKSSMNVSYQESEGYAIIDVSTADRLELVSSTKPAQASRYSTLFGVLNYCVTKVGARLLRSTILQPPASPEIIENTSQCVMELIKNPEVLLSIQTTLHKFSNIDQLLTLTSMTSSTSDDCSNRQLNYLLLLNGLIDVIQPMIDILVKLQQPFYQKLKKTLESENFSLISDKLRTMIHPTAYFAKREAGVTQRCFAIKSGINGLLDLVRKTYSERLNDLNDYVKHLRKKYQLSLTLGNNSTKGYHIVLKLNAQQKRTFKKSDLPSEFIQVYRLSGSCTMKTAELINYSTRLEDIMIEIVKLSNSIIHNSIVDLKQYIGFFYKLCEEIARLDMIQSLSEASRRGKYTRPKFGEFTELVNSRHPMLELLIGDQRVANSITICPNFNVQIITGPNGSGKSIYIRQVMLLQVMAQVGCYVPADSAIFRPMDRMFARIYLEDDMEYGASSFILEMKEIKYMMTLISENSLFIIDELCRSTAANEGAALAMAICEKFCNTPVFLYVTTHYTSLANLANLYINVKTWQMETIADGETPQELSLDFKFNLIPGVTNLKHYGVYIVKKIWPEVILQEVYQILNSCKKQREDKNYSGVNETIRLKYKLESDFKKLKSLKKLTVANVNKLLNDYQNELQKKSIFLNFENDITAGFQRQLSFEDDAIDCNVIETSSYENISNFIHEDSGNVEKLIPEVSVGTSDGEVVLEPRFITDEQVEKTLANSRTVNILTPTQWEPEITAEELESISKSFLEDEEFDFSQASSYQTASLCNQKVEHLIPNVRVIEGPAWSQDSSSSNIPRSDTESISYSPLCSQSFERNNKNLEDLKSKSSNFQTSSSSSLHFLARNSSENLNTSDITVGNLKSASSSTKTSDETKFKNLKAKKRPNRFIPPKKLTRQEIQDEFDKQDAKLYDTDISESDLSKIFQQRLNRPSVRQVQNSKHLVLARKTNDGVEVIPATESTKLRKFSFKRNLSSNSNIDMSIFSDKNAKCFDEFLNSNERDVKRFKFNFNSCNNREFNFQPQSISEYAASIDPFLIRNESESENFHSLTFTPDGFYKENQDDINNIVNKYLREDNPQDNFSLFETCSLNENDLEL